MKGSLRKISTDCVGGKWDLFIDGVQYVKAKKNDFETTSGLSANPVIAIACDINFPPGSIVVVSEDGFFSDSTWRCSRTFQANWSAIFFDDSSWFFAVTMQKYKDKFPLPAVQHDLSQSEGPSWISTFDYEKTGYLYCRKNFMKLSSAAYSVDNLSASKSKTHSAISSSGKFLIYQCKRQAYKVSTLHSPYKIMRYKN